MSTGPSIIKLRFPLRHYIHQLFFFPIELVLWNPKHFLVFHTVQLLEQSLKLDYIEHTRYREFLEHCLKISAAYEQDSLKKFGDNHDHNQINNQ